MAERLFRAIGRPELIGRSRYATNSERLRHADELDAIIGGFIARRTQAENVGFFEKYEVTIGPVYDIAQILEDPHVTERELVADYPDPDMGTFPMHHVTPRLSRTPGAIRAPAPRLGEHNGALLAEIGVDKTAYAKLVAAGIVCEGGGHPKENHNETRTSGVALAAVCAGERREVCRQGAHPRRRLHPARPGGQRARPREGQCAQACCPGREARTARGSGRGGANQPAGCDDRPRSRGLDRPDVNAIAVTKVDDAAHLRRLDDLVAKLEAKRGLAPGHTRFIAMVETPAAFFRMPEIALAVERTAAMDIGGEDFALETGMEPTEDALLMPKQQMIFAARAAGIMPLGYIASVASYGDWEAFRRMVRRSRQFGFLGASCIHPGR